MGAREKATYEWDIEEFDIESGDVLDHDHHDSCPGTPEEEGYRLVLVRSLWGKEGLRHRAWAYVEDGRLPSEFDDGFPIPQRFLREISSDA